MTHTKTKIFISYARKDGHILAHKLQRDLSEQGFEVWLDTTGIDGNRGWSTAIEDAIENCNVALALLSQGSSVSEICHAEHLRCLQKDKQVIPVKIHTDVEIPNYLKNINYHDFTTTGQYADSLAQLVDAISDGTIANTPARTLNFSEHSDEIERHNLLTASPEWMNKKERKFYGDSAYIDELELAIQAYNDPLEPDEIIRLVQLTTARQVVNARIDVYTDKMLVALVRLGREQEAIYHARLRTDAIKRFDGLFAIWQASKSERVTVSELMQVADRKLAHRPPYELTQLGIALAHANDPRADDCFKKARENILSIQNTAEIRFQSQARTQFAEALVQAGHLDEARQFADTLQYFENKEHVLSVLASSFAHAGRFEEARELADTIPSGSSQIRALSQIANALSHADNPGADDAFQYVRVMVDNIDQYYRDSALNALAKGLAEAKRFDEAREIIDAIQDKDGFSKSFALHQLATALIQANRFDEVREVADSIQDASRKAEALTQLTNALVQAHRFDEAREVADSIQSAYGKAGVVTQLFTELAQADDLGADDAFQYALTIANTIQYASPKADSLSKLAIALAQIDAQGADNIFRHAREVAHTIRDDYDAYRNAVALSRLASTLTLADAPRASDIFQLARETANSIRDASRKVSVLSELGIENAETNKPYADEAFKHAREVIESIRGGYGISKKDDALRQHTTMLVRAQRFDEAREVADTIKGVSRKVDTLRELAIALAQVNDPRTYDTFQDALSIANTIQHANAKDDTLRKLAITLAQISMPRPYDTFQHARDIADTIQDASRKADALRELAIALAQVNDPRTYDALQDAHQVAYSIQYPSFQADALRKLAIAFDHINDPRAGDTFQDALDIAKTIPHASTKTNNLREIAIALVQSNDPRADEAFQHAHDAAKIIQDDYRKADTLTKLITVLARNRRYDQALAVAESIQRDHLKADALCKLATTLTQVDDPRADEAFQHVQTFADTIHDSYDKGDVQRKLAIALAQAYRFDQAQEIIYNIRDGYRIANVLSELTKALIQAHHFDQAQEVALTIPEAYLRDSARHQLASALALNNKLKKSISALGLRNLDTYITFLCEWQTVLTDLHPNESKLWQRMILASLEIVCWVRKDYEPIRDIFRASVEDND